MKKKFLLMQGNTSLGDDIWCFSLPARYTCRGGMTPTCQEECYALEFLYRINLERHMDNLKRSRLASFVTEIVKEIRFFEVEVCRPHTSGDFYAVAYIRKWIAIARACPQTVFYFYTRMWRVPARRRALIEFASLPNVLAIWSEDRDTGPSNMPIGERAFLCASDSDLDLVPPGLLVFRDHPKTPMKWVGGSWVCAKEQHIKRKVKMTCSKCKQCFSKGPWPAPKPEEVAA